MALQTSHLTRPALFPPSAFINLNHLGLSQKRRFDAKQRWILSLAARNDLIGVQELHASAARAQDCFFKHVATHTALYNSGGDQPGQCILISNKFLSTIGLHPETLVESPNHVHLVPEAAHGFWWRIGRQVKLFVNVSLHAGNARTRETQLNAITAALANFRRTHAEDEVVIVIGGDRNFVIRPDQHATSSATTWYPGRSLLEA